MSVTMNRSLPLIFLPVVTTAVASDGFAPLTLCESMIPALRWGLRPCRTRACSRSAASITSVTLACCHCLKYQYTVCHGGKSAGRYR